MEHIIKINTYITDGSKFMDMLEARGMYSATIHPPVLRLWWLVWLSQDF